MRIDPEDLRRHYESLSDEGLLDINRSDLALVAQGVYDQEIARRGLDHPPEVEEEEDAYHRPLPVFNDRLLTALRFEPPGLRPSLAARQPPSSATAALSMGILPEIL